jgi:hypothetical protein
MPLPESIGGILTKRRIIGKDVAIANDLTQRSSNVSSDPQCLGASPLDITRGALSLSKGGVSCSV